MEPKFRTSFIPKKTLATTSGATKKRADSLGIITLVILVITLAVVALAVGTFLYTQLLESGIARKSETLKRAEAAFEPALIRELVRLDTRMKEADTILAEHGNLSTFFEALEGLTLQSVQFKGFEMSRVSEGRISISMNGVADDFRGVALQADIFGKSKLIREPIFSNLNIDQNGKAVFNVTALIDPSLIRYVDRVENAPVNTQ